jgi:hypothetical protein
MIKRRLNTVKHRLLVEKDRGNACRKNQEKKTSRFFLANFFRGLSFYGAGCISKNVKPLVFWPFSYISVSMGVYLSPLTPSTTTPCLGTPPTNSRCTKQFLSHPHSL